MSLYALYFDQLISADEASDKEKNYNCIECKGLLRLRHGKRRPHFYHIKNSPSCRLYSKSEDHLILQLQIQSFFEEGSAILERPFPSIGRIGDVCWEKSKIIFEIQCSLIAQKEAEERILDYSSLGYTVIWLLDDRIFNHSKLPPAELYLRNGACYFVSYKKTCPSLFYDQFELIQNSHRLRKGAKLPVALNRPQKIFQKEIFTLEIPEQISRRVLNSELFFEGDLLHQVLLSSQKTEIATLMQNWRYMEKSLSSTPKKMIKKLPWLLHLAYQFVEWLIRKINF